VAALYGKLGVPVVPVALNSGRYWPRRSFLKYPGTIIVEILPPIPPGLAKPVFMAELERRIETASARLLAEVKPEA
jgi:1-acyl-sn-glycerol-3-phosphate acyltransferase